MPLVVLLLALVETGCIHRFRNVAVEPIEARDGIRVRSAVRAHLTTGEAVVFPEGVLIATDTLRGTGVRWSPDRATSARVVQVPLAEVIGMESYRTEVNQGLSYAVSLLTTVAVPLATVAVLCIADPKCFGSCPTFYVEEEPGEFALLAEGFSFSIAPLLEMRDVDRLPVAARGDGHVQLELRNEALETHYINHLELLEVRHAAGVLVLPDHRGRPLAVEGAVSAHRARDRTGRDVTALLGSRDDAVYSTAAEVLDTAAEADLFDSIELVFAPAASDSVALTFRMRNSLLTTVLLYELMLAEPGARALDWQEEMQALGPAMELVRWYAERMGLHVDVMREGRYEFAGRIGDTGPIAWKDVALMVAATPGDSLRVRLRFIADQWRIDRIQAGTPHRPEVRVLPLSAILDAAEAAQPELQARLAAPDDAYLELLPAQRFTLRFDAGAEPAGSDRTFLLASQGFYQEWIRQDWLRTPRSGQTFVPADETMAEALRRYRLVKQELEERFFATRIPVR